MTTTLTAQDLDRIGNEARADVIRLFMPYPVPSAIEGVKTPTIQPITMDAMHDEACRAEAEEHYLLAGMRACDRALWLS